MSRYSLSLAAAFCSIFIALPQLSFGVIVTGVTGSIINTTAPSDDFGFGRVGNMDGKLEAVKEKEL